MLRLARGYLQARRCLRRLDPIMVVGFGGYPSVPTVLAAQHLGLKTLIHEQNAVLGRANRLLATRATRVATAFESVRELRAVDCGKTVWTGNPVRPEVIAARDQVYAPPRNDREVNLLVVGGSQGARVLNQVVPEAMAELTSDQRPKVLHQCGRDRSQELFARYQALDIEVDVQEFIEDMATAYYQADLVVCRAGAMTVAEICAAGLAAILVPYPYAAGNHQNINAQYLVSKGAAIALEESRLSPNLLALTVKKFQDDRAYLLSIARNARALGCPDAIGRITDQCLEVVSA